MRMRLYNEFVEQMDADMLMEIDEAVSKMGGEIADIDLTTKLIRITIDEELEKEAYEAVRVIMDFYQEKREEAMKHPFFGVALIRGDLDG